MNLLATVHLVGMIVALVLALRFTTAETENRPAALAFAGFLACCAVFLWDAGFLAAGLFLRWPLAYGWSQPFILAIGPFFFLYARATTEPAFTWGPRALLHFIVPFLWLPLSALWLLVPPAERIQEIRSAMEIAGNGPSETGDLIILAVLDVYHLVYLGAAWRRLWRARDRVAEEQEEGRSHPVRGIGLFATLVWVIAAVSAVLDFSPWPNQGNGLVALAVVLCIFAVQWALMQPRPFLARQPAADAEARPRGFPEPLATETSPLPAVPHPAGTLEEPAAATVPAGAVAPVTAASAGPEATSARPESPEGEPVPEPLRDATAPPATGASRNDLRPDELALIVSRVRRALDQERLYLEPDLSLHVLAERAKTTRHKLSAALRQGFGASFHQLVSGYRVREAARVLKTRDGAARTIADIAFASGFNTLSAFNAAFRAHFGCTPSEFRDHIAAGPGSADPAASN